jgi:hypothetical protein
MGHMDIVPKRRRKDVQALGTYLDMDEDGTVGGKVVM